MYRAKVYVVDSDAKRGYKKVATDLVINTESIAEATKAVHEAASKAGKLDKKIARIVLQRETPEASSDANPFAPAS